MSTQETPASDSLTTLEPNYSVVSSFPKVADKDTLLSQQGMFAASYNFAWENSVPVVKEMLEAIPQWYHDEAAKQDKELNIDIRVHELLEGQFPASPGWHVDAAVRETSFDDNADKESVSHSLVGTISTDDNGVSNTVFCEDALSFDAEYEELTENNCKLLQNLMPVEVNEYHTKDGDWTLFDPYTIHRVAAAVRDGVRLFVRVSLWNPPAGHQYGLTKTEQVYNSVSLL